VDTPEKPTPPEIGIIDWYISSFGIAFGDADMTITISPEIEARLRKQAEREGQEMDLLVNRLLATAMEWEAQDREEAIAGIRRGLEASDAGRVRPAEEVFRDTRKNLPFGA
jgi:predicted transcriptional regulator